MSFNTSFYVNRSVAQQWIKLLWDTSMLWRFINRSKQNFINSFFHSFVTKQNSLEEFWYLYLSKQILNVLFLINIVKFANFNSVKIFDYNVLTTLISTDVPYILKLIVIEGPRNNARVLLASSFYLAVDKV